MKKRLSKTLAAAGIASRRASEQLIFDGHVQVNGEVVTLPQTLVDLSQDRVVVKGKRLRAEEAKVYFAFHKPRSVLCTNRAKPEKGFPAKIVLDFFPDSKERLFTVGRLDQESEGLLFVTNDGHFSQSIAHPSAGIEKEYLVKTPQEITHEHLCMIQEGAEVEGVWVKPIAVKKVRKGTLKVTVKEGRKHEVRCLMARAKLTVKSLKRIRIGGVLLGSLPAGEFRLLEEDERKAIFGK